MESDMSQYFQVGWEIVVIGIGILCFALGYMVFGGKDKR